MEITRVSFHGDELLAMRDGDKVWVVLKRACEALGLDPEPQRKKLAEKPWATTSLKEAVAEDGRNRELFCLDLDSLPMWLATIEVSRVRPEARDKLVRYQIECAKALRDHFFGKRHASPLLADTYQPWSKTWRNSLMEELCKLKGEVFSGRHPRWAAWINSVIYECLLGKDEYAQLRRRNDGPRHGRNHHQLLRPEVKERFEKHLVVIESLARVSSSLNDLAEKLRAVYQGTPLQLPLVDQARRISP